MSSRRSFIRTSVACASTLLAGCATNAPASKPPPLPLGLQEGAQRPWHLEVPTGSDPDSAPYERMLIAIPEGYAEARKPWPLLVFLHGSGEATNKLDDVMRNGPPMLASKGKQYPMIVCSPQASPEMPLWQPDRLHALLQVLQERFFIDPWRVLATGLSTGGDGVWDWACEWPGDLAGIAPMCGFCDPISMPRMTSVPVRAYHGDQDNFVPLAFPQACTADLRAAGGTASLTVYKGVGHAAWVPAYQDPALLAWMLAQRRP